jgi:hypothetical protein
VVVIKNETIIPVMIFTKKDKKYWDNIRWDSYEKFILDEYDKILEDIDTKNGEEKRFEEF